MLAVFRIVEPIPRTGGKQTGKALNSLVTLVALLLGRFGNTAMTASTTQHPRM
jgi:hypothetical protein